MKGEKIMNAGIYAGLSGIQAGGKLLNVGAQNIAHAQTEGYKQTRAIPMESSSGGVIVHLEKDKGRGTLFVSQGMSREGSNVDIGAEILSNLQAVHLVEANIASVNIQERLLGTLLDIME
jgi:flagellar basal body rod protein FlgG